MSIDNDRLLKPSRKLRKVLKNISKNPTPEEVHALRTNTRRLEATLAAITPDGLAGQTKLLKGVARIRRKAGKVRDMDVLTSFASRLTAKGEDDCRVQLVEHLGIERQRHARKLHAIVAKQSATTRARLKRASAQLEKMLCADQNENCDPDQIPAQATASALKLESKLSDPPRLTRANLHPYRLKVKELHNVLRMAENSDDNEEFVSALNCVKDAIGEWHDWGELLRIATEVLEHANCKLLRELKDRSEKKYEDALSAAESMRKKYLPGRDKGQSGKRVVSEPAWKATTSLAA